MTGHVYYIGSLETLRVKIGYTSRSLDQRLRALQTGSPTKLGVLAWHVGTPELEREIHERFEADRLHGEWFDLSEDLLDHMLKGAVYEMALAKLQGREPPSWAPAALNAFYEGDGWLAELDRALGIQ